MTAKRALYRNAQSTLRPLGRRPGQKVQKGRLSSGEVATRPLDCNRDVWHCGSGRATLDGFDLACAGMGCEWVGVCLGVYLLELLILADQGALKACSADRTN